MFATIHLTQENSVKKIKITIWDLQEIDHQEEKEKERMIQLVMWKQFHWEVKVQISISIILAPIKLDLESPPFRKEISTQTELSKIFTELLKLEFRILLKINLNKSSQFIKIKNLLSSSKISNN